MKSNRFSRELRLLTPHDFKRVMDDPSMRGSQKNFVMLCLPNELEVARIGFVIPKRRVRLSVERNRVKRIMREVFRLEHRALAGLDVVFIARDGLSEIPNAVLREMVIRQFRHFERKRGVVPDTPGASA